MRRSSAVAGVVALFLVGVAVGALGVNLVNRHRPWFGFAAAPHRGMGGHQAGHRLAEDLHRRLDLDAEQQRQVDAIIADTHRETQAIWQDVRPRLVAVIEQGQNRIASILTPKQRQEFDVYRKERAAHLRLLLGTGPH